MSHAERDEMAKLGLAHVQENYGFDKYSEKWQSLLTEIHEKYGSWETRTGYKTWQLEEL